MSFTAKYSTRFKASILNFGLPMGILGLGINVFHMADGSLLHQYFSDTTGLSWLANLLFIVGLSAFFYLGVHYLYALFQQESRPNLIAEWHNPFLRSFLPSTTLTAVLAVLSIDALIGLPVAMLLNSLIVVALLHMFLTFYLINGWFFKSDVLINHHKPTWFILISGNFVLAIALMSYFQMTAYLIEVAWFFYASGLFLWAAFATSILYRLIFEKPITQKLRPSLFIFLAPPSLACIASILLAGANTVETISQVLDTITWLSYSFASVMFALWLLQLRYFFESGVSMAGWSYVYPIAAYGLATQYMALKIDNSVLAFLSLVLAVLVLWVITLLFNWLIKQCLIDGSAENKDRPRS